MTSVLDRDLYWRFSLTVYQGDQVARSCLMLQASIGLDVNVLLMALLAARWHRRTIGRGEIEQADARVKQWRHDVVVPLRMIRQRLKSGPPPAPEPRTATLRNEIKGAELHAEKIEQQVLAEWIDSLDLQAGLPSSGNAHDCFTTAERVVLLYREQASTPAEIDMLPVWAQAVARAAADYRDECLYPSGTHPSGAGEPAPCRHRDAC